MRAIFLALLLVVNAHADEKRIPEHPQPIAPVAQKQSSSNLRPILFAAAVGSIVIWSTLHTSVAVKADQSGTPTVSMKLEF